MKFNMKKLLLFIIGTLILTSCDNSNVPSKVSNVKYGRVEYITIRDVEYEKIVIEGHDFLFRRWHTYSGVGSDLEHSPICSKCKK